MQLLAWQRHPRYAETEIRCTPQGHHVLTLFPEGDDDSVCWVWQLETQTKEGLPLLKDEHTGYDNDKEVARRQAEQAAVEAGFSV